MRPSGFLLIISAPLWILTGSLSVAGASREAIIEFPRDSWREFGKFSRFPQGLPMNIDRASLKRKWGR